MLQTNTVPLPKFHIIQKGNRWKVGDMASLRVWRDTPHRNFNKQIEFTKVEMTQEEFDSLPRISRVLTICQKTCKKDYWQV